ncbi:MAG: DUF1385 domain-containing protein [Syntrophomonadaceae bacterium]|jgi:uncharacterized protein YqhQ
MDKKGINYGGMAVIEGVTMRGPRITSMAVRKSDGTIEMYTEPAGRQAEKFPVLKWPLLRGVYALIESLITGMRMLNKSANLAMDEEEEEISSWELLLTGFFAFLLAVLLFIILPATIVHFCQNFMGGILLQNVLEGIIRIIFFLLYVYLISFVEDIRRVLMYHGAEHKVIFTHEAGEELTIDNARRHSTLHPRCGTSFLLIVMVIAVLVFTLLGEGTLFYRIWSRLAVFPIIAGLGYEFIKFSGKYYRHNWARFLILPGLLLQKLTTREPDDSQLEVAITALKAVLENSEEASPGGKGLVAISTI